MPTANVLDVVRLPCFLSDRDWHYPPEAKFHLTEVVHHLYFSQDHDLVPLRAQG